MSERPPDGGRKSRSDAASRLAALLADVTGDARDDADAPAPDEGGAPRSDAPAGDGDTGGATEVPGVPSGATSPAPGRDDVVATEVAEDEAAAVDDRGLPTVTFDLSSLDSLLGGRDQPTDPADEGDREVAGGRAAVPVDAAAPAAPAREGRPAGDDDADDVILEEARRTAGPATRAGRDDGTPPAEPAPPGRPERRLVDVPTATGADAPFDGDADEDEVPPAPSEGATARLPRVTLRAVAFGVALALLLAAVPVLGYVGLERIGDSRGGQVVDATSDPTEPGYRAIVAPTPTALMIHRDAEGDPASATLLALGAGEVGGTVLQVPLTTHVRVQRLLINTLAVAWESTRDDGIFVREVEDRLGVAVQEVGDVDDGDLADLVAPVAPLSIDNPDDVMTGDGRTFPAGSLELAADDVGPFLRGNAGGEPELARLARNQIVWAAWLEAIHEAGVDDSVGAATTGIGPFLRTLAEGTPAGATVVETLEVTEDVTSEADPPPLVPTADLSAQVIDAVPYPLSPRQGRRFSLKLLNGAEGAALPRSLMRDLMVAGAALSTLGNADELDQDATTIEIASESWREGAEAARFVLGPDVDISVMDRIRAEAEGADMVITVGRDVLDRIEQEGGDGG